MVDSGEIAVDLPLAAPFMLTLVIVVTSSIGEEIHGPTQELLSNGVEESCDWGFFSQLVDFVDQFSDAGGINLPSLGDKNHITIHVSSRLVMLAVGDLPGEIWDQKRRVTDPASCVVENLRGRKRLVTTLVCKNPKPGSKQTLDHRVSGPQRSSNWCRGNIFRGNEFVEEEESQGKAGDIPSDIAQPSQTRSLKAVLGNSVSNIVDSIVWELKLVPIGIDELAVFLLPHLIERGHRRQ